MINVVVIDDHAVVREGLKKLFLENPGMRYGEAGTATKGLRSLRTAL
jgi:DNA-binding NarL/FixJ family response regulator